METATFANRKLRLAVLLLKYFEKKATPFDSSVLLNTSILAFYGL